MTEAATTPETEAQAASTSAATQQPAAQPQAPDLNVSDLMALKSVIDVASQRGAFKAGELESVGRVYNKLSNFLDHISNKGN